jgi:hypothetical protein
MRIVQFSCLPCATIIRRWGVKNVRKHEKAGIFVKEFLFINNKKAQLIRKSCFNTGHNRNEGFPRTLWLFTLCRPL